MMVAPGDLGHPGTQRLPDLHGLGLVETGAEGEPIGDIPADRVDVARPNVVTERWWLSTQWAPDPGL